MPVEPSRCELLKILDGRMLGCPTCGIAWTADERGCVHAADVQTAEGQRAMYEWAMFTLVDREGW